MEYGINFNHNDTVLTALENLDNTFFIEYSNIAPYVDIPFRDITCPKPEIQNK